MASRNIDLVVRDWNILSYLIRTKKSPGCSILTKYFPGCNPRTPATGEDHFLPHPLSSQFMFFNPTPQYFRRSAATEKCYQQWRAGYRVLTKFNTDNYRDSTFVHTNLSNKWSLLNTHCSLDLFAFFTIYSYLHFTSPRGSGCEVLWWAYLCVCVCVCPSVREHISGNTCAIFAKFLCLLPIAVARSSFGVVAIRYVLPF